jgi:GPI mannosyltransferase 3
MAWLEFYEPFRAFILVPLPKIIQSVFAALGDFYTWRLATEIYGIESNVPWAAVSLSTPPLPEPETDNVDSSG